MRLSLVAILFLSCLWCTSEKKHNNAELSLPISLSDTQFKPLRELVDAGLQSRLQQVLIQDSNWSRLISNKKMAVGVVDLRDPAHTKFARVNGDVMMYAASLPKLAVLLASCEAIHAGTLQDTPKIQADLKLMVSRSNNPAATRMIDKLGFAQIERVLTSSHYKLYDPRQGGGFWVGKRYAHTGKRYPDPLKGLTHAASVTQACRFYYLLALGRLVNEQESRRMLDILSDPEIEHKFVLTLKELAPEARLYRKSGTWRQWHSDSVLVWGPDWRRYILVGLIEDSNGEHILRELVRVVEDVLGDGGGR